jgi:Sec-independent protein secretion pathway component TatC
MLVVQSERAKRTRKYSILMIFVLLMIGSPAAVIAIFTLRWDVLAKKK